MIGQINSHFRIVCNLGSGMGVVYEAEDLELGRRVAMKFLHGELASDPWPSSTSSAKRAASAMEGRDSQDLTQQR
jgi:serine/threonine protein kinase